MKSRKCFQCGFVSASVEFCKSCGAAFGDPNPGSGQARSVQPPSSDLRKGMAIASLIVGIISFLTLGLLGIGAVLGIVLAVIAMSKVNRNPWEYGGKGLAIAGLVLSITSLVVVVPIGLVAAIAVPNLLAARRAANEGSSISTLKTLSSAELTYFSLYSKYGTLDQLAQEGLVDKVLATGIKNGYKFTVEIVPADSVTPEGFEIACVPVTYPNSGRRSFFVDDSGVIRMADNHGDKATKFDSPLDEDNPFRSEPARYGGE